MECKEFQKMIEQFDKKTLSLEEMERFVNHVLDCDDCKEELEIYYIVKYGLSDDEDEALAEEVEEETPSVQNLINTYNFRGLADYRLQQSQKEIHAISRNEYYNRCLLMISEVCIAIMLLWYICAHIF